METHGAIFYPPYGFAALLLASLDPWLGRGTNFGAALIVLSAAKSAHETNREGC